MITDAEFLRRFVEDRSEAAFTELVQRHIGLVYSCALRHVGQDAHLAEDVTQQVFCDLARKAPSLLARPALAGWLYVGAHHAAAAVVRRERRRKLREEQATTMENILQPSPSGPEPDWTSLRPLLDDLILDLDATDRDAVMLRFFERRPFAEIATALRLTEDAARKRTERAVEKLRARLAERGVTSGTGALAFALAGQAAATVPAALAGQVAGVAFATAGAGGSLLAPIAGALVSDAAAVAVTLLAAAGLIAWQHQATATLRAELADRQNSSAEIQSLQRTNLQLAKRLAETEDLQRALATSPAPRAAVIAATTAPRPATPVKLTVTAQGTLQWNGEPVTLADFTARLAAIPRQQPGREPPVIVHGMPGAGFGAVSYAVEQASRAGIKDIAVDSPATPGPADNWITPAAALLGPNEIPPPSIPDPKAHP